MTRLAQARYVIFFRLHGMREMSADQLAATVGRFDRGIAALPSSALTFSSPYGGGALLATVDEALDVTSSMIGMLGARVSAGLTRGMVNPVSDVTGLNWVGHALNRAARLAYLDGIAGRAAASEEFTADAMKAKQALKSGFFGTLLTGRVKRTDLTYRMIDDAAYVAADVPSIAPSLLRPEPMHVLLVDIVNYSDLGEGEQVEAVETLARVVARAHSMLGRGDIAQDREIRYAPAGDGGAVIFGGSQAVAATTVAAAIQTQGSVAKLRLRIGVESGQMVSRERGVPLGPAVLDADVAAQSAVPGQVCFTERFLEHLPEWKRKELAVALPTRLPIAREEVAKEIAVPEARISIERLPVSGDKLFGREAIVQALEEAWADKRTNIVCLIGLGGEGKTAIVNHWIANLLSTADYHGARAVFGWSFDSQELDPREVSADTFMAEALQWFGEASPPSTPWERGRRLAEIIKSERAIVILDGLEAVMERPDPGLNAAKLKDQSLQALVRVLAAQNLGLCLISSRIRVFELSSFAGKTVRVIDIGQLGPEPGGQLLKDIGVTGPEEDFRAAVDEYEGHALSLTLLGTYLREVKDGDIRRRNELDLDEPDPAQRVMRSYEQWLGEGAELDVLRVLGLFNRPAPMAAIEAVCTAPAIPGLTENLVDLSPQSWNRAVAKLRAVRLLADAARGAAESELDTHAIVRRHFAQQLRDGRPEAWREGNRRLFEYYRQRPKELPDTLEEMADLFQATVHGCRAGEFQEAWDAVYWPRIRRDEEGYSVTQLNAYGADLVALSGFFPEGRWERPSPHLGPMAAAGACTEAAFDLRGLGRLHEATRAQVAGLQRHKDLGNWWGACDAAGNLSEMLIMHGQLAKAQESAEESIQLAMRAARETTSEEVRTKARGTLSTNLATLGEVLHHRGDFTGAEEQFVSAERLLRDVVPGTRFLHGLRGYHYCDLLLTLGRLDEVEEHAAFAAEADARDGRLFGVGLAHLAAARRCTAKIAAGDETLRPEARQLMDRACGELRRAGHHELILRGLIASAELRRLTNDFPAARSELEEVLGSVVRGQMRLLEADARLQIAALEKQTGNVAALRSQVAVCRRLLHDLGYLRREAELRALEDAPPVVVEPAASAAQRRFAEATKAFVDLCLRCDPVEGTMLGLRGSHDAKLPPSDPHERADLVAALTTSAYALRAAGEASSNGDDRIDGELAVAGVRGLRIIEDALQPYGRNPGVYLDGVLRGVYALMMRTDLPAEEKIDAITDRLRAAPAHLTSARRCASRAPRVLVENAAADAEGALQFLDHELRDFIAASPDAPRKDAAEQARRATTSAVSAFHDFVGALAGGANEEFALGRAAFDALLRDAHQLTYDARELHELGQQTVAALETKLGDASVKTAGHRRWWEAMASIEERVSTRASLLDDYSRVLDRAREFVVEHDLADLAAVAPLLVRTTPPFARANLPFAAYIPVPPFAESGNGELWITPPDDALSEDAERAALRKHHAGRVLVACVHEGYPGHHTQFAHAAHVKRPVRHFFASTVFSEGWGLYCEDLMRREGFLMDDPAGPLLEISILRDSLWRALRIVIDVGLHCGGMSREAATQLFVEKRALDRASAEAEVMFSCSAPTQPMSYMVGRLLVEELVAKRRDLPLGRVHDQILAHGSLPFPLLERAIAGGVRA